MSKEREKAIKLINAVDLEVSGFDKIDLIAQAILEARNEALEEAIRAVDDLHIKYDGDCLRTLVDAIGVIRQLKGKP